MTEQIETIRDMIKQTGQFIRGPDDEHPSYKVQVRSFWVQLDEFGFVCLFVKPKFLYRNPSTFLIDEEFTLHPDNIKWEVYTQNKQDKHLHAIVDGIKEAFEIAQEVTKLDMEEFSPLLETIYL